MTRILIRSNGTLLENRDADQPLEVRMAPGKLMTEGSGLRSLHSPVGDVEIVREDEWEWDQHLAALTAPFRLRDFLPRWFQ